MSVVDNADGRNAAGFRDVACVRYYRDIRTGARRDARQIGYGVNKWPVSATVHEVLHRVYGRLLGERVTEYDGDQDIVERRLIAGLVSRYLDLPGLDADHVSLFNGTTEVISVVTAFAARHGMRPVLPLPVYYAFEQSAARHGMPPPVHYNHRGDLAPWGRDEREPLVIDIAPNGVTGGWFTAGDRPLSHLRSRLRLVDHVFALPTFDHPDHLRAELRTRAGDLRHTALAMTPSKDLSLPGIRCGVLVSRDPEVHAYARADRFERGYALHAGLGSVAAVHLAMLLISLCPPAEVLSLATELGQEFAAAAVPFPDDLAIADFRLHMQGMREGFLRNLDLVDRAPSLVLDDLLQQPAAGYSAFRWLAVPFESFAEFTSWVRSAGQAGLKLNPNLLFGGDQEAWQTLYPDRYGIRVNLSVPPPQLRTNLRLLESLLP
uniref:Aminotransferase n=1 Tax=Streptomyces sp. NRRL 30471 TaxID=996287 RepID=F2WUD6_9ACTN|nr:aminotransferase [Streptomyces sp. NRRL 30471]